MVLSFLQFFYNHCSFHWCKEQTNIHKLYVLSFKIFFNIEKMLVYENLYSDILVFRVLIGFMVKEW